MVSPKLIEETKQSALFKELCTLLVNGTNPSSIVLTALVCGIEIGRSQQTFPLPPILDEDVESVLKSTMNDKTFLTEGLNDLLEYMPIIGNHVSIGYSLYGPDIASLVAQQLVFFFMIQRRAAERKQVEDLEYLVRG